MCFTVADVDLDLGIDIDRFKLLLQNAEPTYYECKAPPDKPPCSPEDAFYTLYSVDDFDDFLDALEKRNEHMARYVLTGSGELCFGHEGESGKTIAEHWQMLGEETLVIAAGNLFVTHGKITGLNDQSPCTTGLLSLIYTLRAFHEKNLPLAHSLELIQTVPDKNGKHNLSMTKTELQAIINRQTYAAYDADDECDDEDVFVDGVREEAIQYNRRPPSAAASSLSFFYNTTDEQVRFSQEQLPNHELADATETRTTGVVVRT